MSTSNPSRIFLKVAGSFISAIAGVLVGVIAMRSLGWESWRTCVVMIGIFAAPVWALVLLPLHVLLPRTSGFWYPSVSAGGGAAVGAVLLTAYLMCAGAGFVLWLFIPIGILVGFVTGLVGSLFARLYETHTA